MKITENTVLIIGGSQGIGFEIAKQLSEKNNYVILVGRDKDRLKEASEKLENVTAILADISSAEDTSALIARIYSEFPKLNVVINNAAAASAGNLIKDDDIYEKAKSEIETNYLSIIRLNQKLLPLLQKQSQAAIVNVSSVVAFVPGLSLPTYAASKAALHSYTQSLRLALKDSNVSVFELMPPLVNTTFSAPAGGHKGIAPSQVADEFIKGFDADEFEIHVAGTAQLYKLFLSSPAEALLAINQPR